MRSIWLRVALGLVALAAGLAVVGDETGFPSGYWEPRQTWVIAARFTLVVVAFLEPARQLVAGHLDKRDRDREALVEEALYYTLYELDKATSEKLKWYDIGIHVWEVRGLFTPTQRLEKVARIRVKDDAPGGSRIRWTKGKGAIGNCWETGEGGTWELKGFPPKDKSRWNEFSDEQKMGFDYDEAQRAKGYGCIVVAPMLTKDKGTFKGCVSVDGPVGTLHTLRSDAVESIVKDCANLCASKLYDA